MLNGRALPTFLTIIRNTDPGSNAGIPGLSVPVGMTSGGLPVGLAFDSRSGADRDLLGLVLAVETVFPVPRAP
jgi:mandelamide amidase